MGVLLTPIVVKDAIGLADLRGKRLAVDANGELYQFLALIRLPDGTPLRDSQGRAHPVVADIGCRNTVFNSLAQTGAEYVAKMIELGVRHFRVEFVNESADQVAQTIEKYRLLLRSETTGLQLWRELKLLSQLTDS